MKSLLCVARSEKPGPSSFFMPKDPCLFSFIRNRNEHGEEECSLAKRFEGKPARKKNGPRFSSSPRDFICCIHDGAGPTRTKTLK